MPFIEHDICKWVGSYVGEINNPAPWGLLAKIEESPATFSCMVLQFLDEFDTCFSVDVASWVDSMSLLYDQLPRLRDLLQACDCLFGIWIQGRDSASLARFNGQLLGDLYLAVRKFTETTGDNRGEEMMRIESLLRSEAQRHRITRSSSVGGDQDPDGVGDENHDDANQWSGWHYPGEWHKAFVLSAKNWTDAMRETWIPGRKAERDPLTPVRGKVRFLKSLLIARGVKEPVNR